MITINGPAFKTAEYESPMEEVTNIYQNKSHKNILAISAQPQKLKRFQLALKLSL